MHFPALPTALLLTLALHGGANAAASDDKKTPPAEPCTVSSSTGSFYDLRSLAILSHTDDKKKTKGAKTDDWHVKGWDYQDSKANFTLNICAPVVDPIESAVGISNDRVKNTSAYYTLGSKNYSIGWVVHSQISRSADNPSDNNPRI
jgi:cation-dependent mannose-6-phosphate receptor